MNNEERDNMLIDIHGTVKVIAGKAENHDDTLYGNSKPGLVKDVTLLQERQDQCPARKALTVEAKRLTISHILIIVAILTLFANVALAVLNWVGKQ